MFKKEYHIIIEAQDGIEVANKLAAKRLWFQIGSEYLDYTDPGRRWFRKVRVRASKQELVEIFKLNEVVCGSFVD